MIIAITGLSGSGKNTLGELVANEFNLKIVCPTFKDLAKAENMSLMEFQKKAEKDPDIDFKFDKVLKEQAKKDCVVTTWLGPWIVENADIKIKLHASAKTRAQRVLGRDKMGNISEAIEHIKNRDEQNRSRYKKIYGIDIYENDIFDAVLSSEKFSPKELLEIVKKIVEVKTKGKR
jgi:cytidylate kinase